MEEEDPVIKEIPVYLSQALAENLYIYQYPVRPANREWKDVKVVNASIKPKNQLVRVEVGLDTYSDKYCFYKGEQIAQNTDGQQESRFIKDKEREKAQYFRGSTMDKIVFESSTPCVDTQHYAVALLQDKELHCTPIKGIVKMRPSCSYYDKQDKRNKDKNKAENSDDEEKEPEAQQVTVKFARQETEVAKKAREKSFDTISQRISSEPWYHALWKHADTDTAELERLKLFSANTSQGSALSLRGRDYVRALVPPPPPDEADVMPAARPEPQDQLNDILNNAKLMSFSDLRALIRTEEGPLSESALLSLLSGHACCVRGLWTQRSAALGAGAGPGAPAAALRRAAREHVLYLFTQHSYIDRRKVTAAVRLPPQEVLEIIQSVAKYNPKTGWELLIPPDVAFEAKYPEVIQRQNLYWEARQRLFNEMLMGEAVPKRQRKKSQRDSVSSDIMSPKARCNSVSEEDSDRKRKNKSVGGGKRTRNVSSSSAHET